MRPTCLSLDLPAQDPPRRRPTASGKSRPELRRTTGLDRRRGSVAPSKRTSDQLGETLEYLDRLFLVRLAEGSVDEARSADDFAAASTEGSWHAIVADSPSMHATTSSITMTPNTQATATAPENTLCADGRRRGRDAGGGEVGLLRTAARKGGDEAAFRG
jgi:hypothetical protein